MRNPPSVVYQVPFSAAAVCYGSMFAMDRNIRIVGIKYPKTALTFPMFRVFSPKLTPEI